MAHKQFIQTRRARRDRHLFASDQGRRDGDLSGQIGLDPHTMQLAEGARRRFIACSRTRAVASAADSSFDDLVKLNGISPTSHFAKVNETYTSHFRQPYPACAAVGVARCRETPWWKWMACWSSRIKRASRVPLRFPPLPLAGEGWVRVVEHYYEENNLIAPAKIPPATLSKLAKLGIHHRTDLLLHLPLRYEDETHLAPIDTVQPGMNAQVQGVITHSEITFRPRRTLVCRLQDSGGELYLRFLNFYPSQQKQLAEGKQIRAVGEARTG